MNWETVKLKYQIKNINKIKKKLKFMNNIYYIRHQIIKNITMIINNKSLNYIKFDIKKNKLFTNKGWYLEQYYK